MKREHSYIIGALALAGAILLAEADTVKNGFVEVVGEGARANGDRDVVLHEPEDPSEVKVSTQAGWRFTDPQDAAFLHHVGATDLIHLVNESKESEATIKITDDWEHTCEKTNWEEHVSAPKLVVVGADHALILLKPDDIGVFLETNCTASAGEDGIHNVWTECKPCRHPDCRGRNPLKWMEEKKIHAPDQVEGEIRASGRIFVDPDRDDGYYLLEGPHELLYTASFDLEECAEHLCVGGAVTNTTWDVCRLSVTNTPYLGIDLTDEGKKTNAVGIAEARYGYRPKNTAASYYWEFKSSRHGVIASQDDEKGTARLESARPAEPSDTYQGDKVVCHATLTETNPPDGHNPCVASADVTSPVTVVRVDVVMDDVDEDKEETEGAMLYYIPDAENGEWTEEGTNELRKIRFVCEPDDGEMLKHEIAVTAPEGLLFEKVGKEYYPAKETYTVEELNKKEFRVHGHRRSEKYLGDEIEAVHLPSGAKDKVKLTIFGRPLLVPDYDRNGKIDEADDARAQDGKTIFRFWINDDDDNNFWDGFLECVAAFKLERDENSEPGANNAPRSGKNYADDKVNGRMDMEDFTPILADYSEVFPDGTPEEFVRQSEMQVRSDCVNAVWTPLKREAADQFLEPVSDLKFCGEGLNEYVHKAKVTKIENWKRIPKQVINAASNTVMLIEGASKGEVFEIGMFYGETKISHGNLKIVVSDVDKMYRWMDLRPVCNTSYPDTSNLEVPENGPDEELNGIDRHDEHIVFVHGYNVNEESAAGWAATIFKRLWQSGSNARFTAVDWMGNETQDYVLGVTANYYVNVENAFKTARALVQAEHKLPGKRTYLGHSMGNMVVSAAIRPYMPQKGGAQPASLTYKRYYMLNAAVAQEAYSDSHYTNVMREAGWNGINQQKWSWAWHELFADEKYDGDMRRRLTWKNRFGQLPRTVNCYSATEDVLANIGPGGPGEKSIGGDWVKQELFKGCTVWRAANGIFPNHVRIEGGWGINSYYLFRPRYYVAGYGFIPIAVNGLSDDAIIEHPLFTPFRNNKRQIHSLKPYKIASFEVERELNYRFLADAIPAMSFAAGRNPVAGLENVEYVELCGKETWPRDDYEWQHSDIKNVAYCYMRKLYKMIAEGKEGK